MLFGAGRLNFNIFFLKVEKLSEPLILLSILLHCMLNIELRNIVTVSCSVCTSNDGDIIDKILGRLVFVSLKQAKFPIPLPLLRGF